MAVKAEPNGVFAGVDREAYDRSPRANFSTLKWMDKSPAHYRHQLVQRAKKVPQKDTESKRVGRGTHMAVLQPDVFATECVVWDGGRRNSNAWEAFKAANQGKEILDADEHQQCLDMQTASRADAGAAKYLSGGSAELTVYWTHVVKPVGAVSGYSIDCKARLDFVADIAAIVDLKTGRDICPSKFGRQSWDLNYLAQAAMYVDGYREITGRELPYVLFGLENEPPYVTQVYTLTPAHMNVGREKYRGWLDRVDHCRKTNRYPGYWDGELELELPRWALDPDEDLSGLGLEGLEFNAAEQE